MKSLFDFTAIGLTNRDKRIYEALLATPGASLRKLADDTGINRGSAYESIKDLTAAGLVGSVQKGQRQQYIAQDPALITEILEERRQAGLHAERQAHKYIEALSSLGKETGGTPSFAVYYEGDEGVAAILRDVLKTMRSSKNKHYQVVSSKRIRNYIYHNFANYTQQRIKAGIGVSVIAVGEGGEQDQLANRVWLPDTVGDSNCYTIIYDTKTAFISLNDENVLSGIVIDNDGVANLQRLLFQQIWTALQPSAK
jgi:sugar-specific transcriptional regulator TrmB